MDLSDCKKINSRKTITFVKLPNNIYIPVHNVSFIKERCLYGKAITKVIFNLVEKYVLTGDKKVTFSTSALTNCKFEITKTKISKLSLIL